ncbi:MAG: DUF5677 domain-containing protein [Desulfomonilaceae bacterium]
MGRDKVLERIITNPDIFGGKPVIRGHSLTVEHVLEMLDAGDTPDKILEEYDWLEPEDIAACLIFDGRSVFPLATAVWLSDRVFQECRSAAPRPEWYDFPSLALYRHIIQMADGIEILLSAGTSAPSLPLLRSMMEALLSLKYIHTDQYEQRSLCWLCAFIHQEIDLKDMIDSRTESGKHLHDVIANEFDDDTVAKAFEERSSGSRTIRELRRELDRLDLADIETEYQRVKEQKRKRRKWYQPRWHELFRGPKSIYALAENVEMLRSYLVCYQLWSATVHGTDATRLLFTQEDGRAEFRSLRFLDDPDRIELDAELFLRLATDPMVKRFLQQ